MAEHIQLPQLFVDHFTREAISKLEDVISEGIVPAFFFEEIISSNKEVTLPLVLLVAILTSEEQELALSDLSETWQRIQKTDTSKAYFKDDNARNRTSARLRGMLEKASDLHALKFPRIGFGDTACYALIKQQRTEILENPHNKVTSQDNYV